MDSNNTNDLINAHPLLNGLYPGLLKPKYWSIRLAPTNMPILLCGEPGTENILFADFIQSLNKRSCRPYRKISCGSISINDFKEELKLADTGTAYLKRIYSLSFENQDLLLQTLEENKFHGYKNKRLVQPNIRIIADTSKDLADMVRKDCFNAELYIQFKYFQINIPPLRERLEDIEHLVKYFLKKISQDYNFPTPYITKGAKNQLCKHLWPGNITELYNFLFWLILSSPDNRIICSDVKEAFDIFENMEKTSLPDTSSSSIIKTNNEIETENIYKALKRTGGNKKQAAKLLDISPSTLQRKLKKLGQNESSYSK